MYKTILLIMSFFSTNIVSYSQVNLDKKTIQDAIIDQHVYNCADKVNFRIMMHEYQTCLDEGIKKDSTIAYLWQQKAMPYFKMRKYEIGMPLIDKAVKYDAKRWQPYRAFIKCVFAKTYRAAIADFQDCISKYGNNYEMDHTYSFYIGISYLQLNEFKKAEETLQNDINAQIEKQKEAHFIDWFYLAIAQYEQQKWAEAIESFNQSLQVYENFADAQYYKAIAMARSGYPSETTQKLLNDAIENGKKGYTINEDNAIYEMYPYQLKWQ